MLTFPCSANIIQSFRALALLVLTIVLVLPMTAQTTAGQPRDPQAAEAKFREAIAAYEKQDATTVIKLAKEVLTLDPEFKGANLILGIAYRVQNNAAVALEHFHREQEVNRTDPRAYFAAQSLLQSQGRLLEAAEEMRKFLAVDPSNGPAALVLGSALMNAEKYSEAASVLESAARFTPGNAAVRHALANAYLRSGQIDKATALLDESVKTDPTPQTLNNVAYLLADADVSLPKAQGYAEEAVRRLETLSVQASTSDERGLPVTSLLANAWDTLGWVYFRTGDFEKAVSYLEAAWNLTQHAEPGNHLGQVYEKLGRKKEAEHIYELASAGFAVPPGMSFSSNPARTELMERRQKLMTEKFGDTRLPRRVAGAFLPFPGEELSRMRTTKIAIPRAKKGSATFSIVITPEKNTEVRFVSGDPDMDSVAPRLQAAKLNQKFPAGSTASLVRRGILVCTSLGCDFVLIPIESSRAVQ